MFRLLALILPLALDTFAVSAAIGMAGIGSSRRLGLALLFAAFEGGMPLIGLSLGAMVSLAIGGVADYLAIVLLAGLGLYILFGGDEEKEEARVLRFATSNGIGLVGVGLTVSLDELAIGFALGLSRVPIFPALLLIAIQAFAVSQIGFALGRLVTETVREGSARAAGVVLIAIAGALLLAKFGSIPI
jgi:putative Mn2+ efflux pump MntP